MATLYIAEYSALSKAADGSPQIAGAPPVTEQTVTIAGASAQSAAFNDKTKFIRVHTDAICSIAIGKNPTATAAKQRIAADQTEYFGVTAGHKLAVITNT